MELPERPGGTAPHTVVDDVAAPVLVDADRHHLERVLRLRSGDLLSVTDGRGRWRWCRLADDGVVPAGDVRSEPDPSPALTVGFALVKGDRPELVVQKLTELGVDRIVPFAAERSVVRWDAAKAGRQAERLRRVAREAACQCRRVWWPEVLEVAAFDDVARLPGVARADRDGDPPDLARSTILVGPEGGWSPSEREAVPATVGLGPTVLRAETASLAVASLLTALRAGVVAPRGTGAARRR